MQRHRVVKGEKFSVAGTAAGGKGGTGQDTVWGFKGSSDNTGFYNIGSALSARNTLLPDSHRSGPVLVPPPPNSCLSI